MFLDLNKIAPEGVSFDTDLVLDDLRGPGTERYPVTGVRMAGRVAPSNRGAELRAHLQANVELPCSRCLEPCPMKIDEDVYLILITGPTDPSTGEIEVDADDAALLRVEDGRADLAVVATEQIYLQLPLKPVCSEACRGLCPECGANRNTAACECSEPDIDPRLAPLLQFKKDSKTH